MPKPHALLRDASHGGWIALAGDAYRFLARGEDTDGALAVLEAVIPPGGGPPPHTHTHEDESFFVIEGEVTFRVAGERRTLSPGGFVMAPRGVSHAFRNESTLPARMLIQWSPAGLERMFDEVGWRIADAHSPPPASLEQIEKLMAAAPSYGIAIHTAGGPSSLSE